MAEKREKCKELGEGNSHSFVVRKARPGIEFVAIIASVIVCSIRSRSLEQLHASLAVD